MEVHCPNCSEVCSSKLPKRIPIIDSYPAACWNVFKMSIHLRRNHPIDYDRLR